MRLRSITQVYEHYKKVDPEGAISKRLVREIVNSGNIPVLHSGRKALVDLDVFERYLSGETFTKDS